jgi:hypothetical protein
MDDSMRFNGLESIMTELKRTVRKEQNELRREELAEALHEAALQCEFPLDAESFGDLVWWGFTSLETGGLRSYNAVTRVLTLDGDLAQHYIDLMEEGE